MGSLEQRYDSLLGVGLFSIGDTSRLTGVNGPRIRRWLLGYRYRTALEVKQHKALWRPEVPTMNGTTALSFNDLLEIRLVGAFRGLGFSIQKIRRAISELSKIAETAYPFSQQKVVTDGVYLFAQLKDEEGKPLFYDLSDRRNYAFPDVIYPMLRKGLFYDQAGRVTRWYPDPDRNQAIVVDPAISFGRPVIDGTRINVAVLAYAYKAERSFDRVAEWYDIDPALVRQAVDFHERYLA